jgi:hypothetical protein
VFVRAAAPTVRAHHKIAGLVIVLLSKSSKAKYLGVIALLSHGKRAVLGHEARVNLLCQCWPHAACGCLPHDLRISDYSLIRPASLRPMYTMNSQDPIPY